MSNSQPLKILLIDGDKTYLGLLKTLINKLLPQARIEEYRPVKQELLADHLDWGAYAVLILDNEFGLKDMTGISLLRRHHKRIDFPATIMLLQRVDASVITQALQYGCCACLHKDGLEKDQLRQSILSAWEKKKEQKERWRNQILSKRRAFFEGLRPKKEANALGSERVLLFIQLDDVEMVEKQIGLKGRNDLVKQLAKVLFEDCQQVSSNPDLLPYSDTVIALQMDSPITHELLTEDIERLCGLLSRKGFEYNGAPYQYSVSIGAVSLDGRYKSVDENLRAALAAADRAASGLNKQGHSFYIWLNSDHIPQQIRRRANSV